MKNILKAWLIGLTLTVESAVAQLSRGPFGPVSEVSREATPLASNLLLIALLGASAYTLYNLYTKKKEKKKVWVAPAIVLALFWVYALAPAPSIKAEIPAEDWQENYEQAVQTSLTDAEREEFLAETDYYDYSSPEIQSVMNEVLGDAANEEDAVSLALEWVYLNIEYDWDESDQYCFDGKASEIISRESGQCDTQSIALIAILRGMGIASKPVGGCISKTFFCDFKQGVFAAIGKPIPEPKYKETVFNESQETYSRTKFTSRAGGLHAWVEVWLPDTEWITLEATTGRVADTKCWDYEVELYPSNDNKEAICVSNDLEFALRCSKK